MALVRSLLPSFRCRRFWGVQLQKLNVVQNANMRSHEMSTTSAIEAALKSGRSSHKVYADHVFYKGKCALNMRLIRPTLKATEAGDISVAREGCLLLEFAPAVGTRQYDWGKKQLFSLSIGELGQILSLMSNDSLEFFHDPNMGKSDAGKIRKSLKIEPTTDKSGYFFNLNVHNKADNRENRFNIPISRAEFAVMRCAANYAVPYLMGWHFFTDPSKIEESMFAPPSPPPSGVSSPQPGDDTIVTIDDIDDEWDK